MMRLMRLRTTADGADLREMAKPRRGKPRELGRASTVKYGSPDFTGCAKTWLKSALLLSLARREKRALSTSGSEARPTLGSTGGDHAPPRFGGHAGTESVGTLAMDDTGLESPLHDGTSVCLADTGWAGPKTKKCTVCYSLLSRLRIAFFKFVVLGDGHIGV